MFQPKQISSARQKEKIAAKLEVRSKVTLAVRSDKKKRALAYELCKNDFIYWCNNFCWIQNPKADDAAEKEIPFILFNYQEETAGEIIKAINRGYDLPIEKSREMGLSWLIVAICVWGWNFHKWECLLGSQKGENVDTRGNIKSLMEKARYILYRSPKWLIPPLIDKIHDKHMLLLHPQHRATIAGESNNPNFGRSDRRKVIVFDEFTSWEQTDRAAWQACASTTKCRIPISTPNTRGVNCHFFTIMQDAKKIGKPHIRLHWVLHPYFAEGLYYNELNEPHSPWYDNEIKRASTLSEVSQELDIDYEASMAGKVFPDFSLEKNVPAETIEYNNELPLYLAWDFGLDATAIIWIQHNPATGLYYIIDEYQNSGKGAGTDIYHYIDIIESKEYKHGLHYGDPQSGESRSLTSGTSNANILRRHGYVFRSQRTKINNRIGAARNILPNVRISNKCVLTIEMFTSWQLKRQKSGNTNSQVPDHNEYSHIGDAFSYFAFGHSQRANKAPVVKKVYTPALSGVVY